MRRIAVLDAPTNLGLRPPTSTSVPGCSKAPGALRDQRLIDRLQARDAGCLTPPRYDPGDWRPGDGVAHADDIARYSLQLADRIGGLLTPKDDALLAATARLAGLWRLEPLRPRLTGMAKEKQTSLAVRRALQFRFCC